MEEKTDNKNLDTLSHALDEHEIKGSENNEDINKKFDLIFCNHPSWTQTNLLFKEQELE